VPAICALGPRLKRRKPDRSEVYFVTRQPPALAAVSKNRLPSDEGGIVADQERYDASLVLCRAIAWDGS